MEFLNTWVQGIIVAVVIATILEMILPNGNNKKYIKMIIGIFIMYNIVSPVITKFTGKSIEFDDVIDIEKYVSDTKKYKLNTNEINKQYENNIQEVYILNLKKDIKSKIEEKGYFVNTIKIELDNTKDYEVSKLSLVIYKNNVITKENEYISNRSDTNNEEYMYQNNKIRKVEDININVDLNSKETTKAPEIDENEKYEALNDKDIQEVKELINLEYKINKDIIFINQ